MTANERSPLIQAPPASSNADSYGKSEETPKLTRSAVLIVCGTFLGEFLASADESLMTSTYSAIASEFHSLSRGSWLLVAYNFGYCVSSPVYGVLGDLFGRKNVILWSYLFFALGCIACGASNSLIQLILARVLAGVSAAGMVSLVSVIITDIMPPNEVVMFRNYGNMVNITGRSLGAPLGGFLTETVGWRWSFFGQIPLVIASILITARHMPSSLNQPKKGVGSSRSKIAQIDFSGIISFATMILLFLFMLENIEFGAFQQSRLTYILGGAFVASTTMFFALEIFWATAPLIPLDLMKKSFGGYCLSQALITLGRSALVPTIVPYFVRVDNSSDFLASLANVVVMLGVPVGGYLAGVLIKRTNRYKTLGIIAVFSLVPVYILIFLRWRNGCQPWEVSYLFPFGFVLGVLFSTHFVGVTSSVMNDRLGQCIGTYYLFQQLGRIIGPVLGLAMVQEAFKDSLWKKLHWVPNKWELIKEILDDARFAFTLPESMQQVVRSSYLHGFQFVPLFCALCTLFSLPVLAFAKEGVIG